MKFTVTNAEIEKAAALIASNVVDATEAEDPIIYVRLGIQRDGTLLVEIAGDGLALSQMDLSDDPDIVAANHLEFSDGDEINIAGEVIEVINDQTGLEAVATQNAEGVEIEVTKRPYSVDCFTANDIVREFSENEEQFEELTSGIVDFEEHITHAEDLRGQLRAYIDAQRAAGNDLWADRRSCYKCGSRLTKAEVEGRPHGTWQLNGRSTYFAFCYCGCELESAE